MLIHGNFPPPIIHKPSLCYLKQQEDPRLLTITLAPTTTTTVSTTIHNHHHNLHIIIVVVVDFYHPINVSVRHVPLPQWMLHDGGALVSIIKITTMTMLWTPHPHPHRSCHRPESQHRRQHRRHPQCHHWCKTYHWTIYD